MEKTFKILSIDGGGIKGLYSASVLSRIEEKTEKKISDYFDLICGTSTGGLIALGLSIGIPAQALADLFYDRGAEIFPISNHKPIRFIQRKWQFIKQLLLQGKFSNNALTTILEETFGDKTMGDAQTLLCIPSFNLIKGQPRVFKYPHKEGKYYMDKDIRMVDVALATSAAPTYLPVHEHQNILYADGGLWANNPTLCGLLEALDHFVGPGKEFDSFSILSIASVEQPSGWASTSKRQRSFRYWGNKLFQVSIDGQAYFIDLFLRKVINNIYPSGTYYRIPSPVLSKEHVGVIDMDRADTKALKTLKGIGNHEGYHHAIQSEVLEFFKEQKLYKTT